MTINHNVSLLVSALFLGAIILLSLSSYIYKKISVLQKNPVLSKANNFFILARRTLIYLFLITIMYSLSVIFVPNNYLYIIDKAVGISIIVFIAWIFMGIINTVEKLIMQKFISNDENFQHSKKLLTQLTLIKRILATAIIIIAMCAILISFDKMRELGTTLLASAGILAAIGSFAAQKSLSNIFSGLQMAFTQPIKIDDTVLIEKEFGTIEDINLTYVVVRLWDLRRLIVPINYFIEKPFQNWSRESDSLLGVVLLYGGYNFPIDAIRQYFNEIIEKSPLWDHQICKLHVTDANEKSIELRFLMSADDSNKLWELRCYIRESLIKYIQHHYPESLPKVRIETDAKITT